MAKLAAIGVSIDPRGANRGLKEVRGQFRKTSRQSKKSGKTMQASMKGVEASIKLLKAGVVVLLAAFSVRAFAGMINGMTMVDDQVGKTAGRLGIAVEKLSELRIAAELSGVAANTLQMALQRMTRRVAEAATGSGEAKDAIAELGLSAENLNRLAPDEQLRLIAESLSNVENHSDKVRLAFKLFDSEGVSLLQMLENGTEGLDDMAEAARKTGGVLTKEGAEKAAAYNDAVLLLTKTWEGLKRKVVDAILPELTQGIEDLTSWFQNMMAETDGDPLASFRTSLIKTSIDILTTARNVAIFITAMAALLTLLGLAPAALAAITAGAIAIGANEAINALEAKLADARQEESTRLKFEEEGRRVHEEASGMSDDDSRNRSSTTNTTNRTSVQVVAVVDSDKKVVSFKSEAEIQIWAENELAQGLQHLDRRGL